MARSETDIQRVRLGLIGAGWWATAIQLPFLVQCPDVELVAVCRLGDAEVEVVRERFGFQYATTDYQDLVQQSLDAIIVASPHPWHYTHARAALEAGHHVLVEKPMATHAVDARELVTLANRKQRHLMVPQGWNFTPYTRIARQLVRSGAIGEVRHVVCQMASAVADLMAGESLIETEGALFRPPAATWADPANAGGYGWGQLVHALGVMFGIADLTPAHVFALAGHSPTGVDYYDAISIRFANGATAAVSGAATLPKPAGAQHDRGKGYQIDIRMFGTEGVLLFDIERERVEIRRVDGQNTTVPMQSGDGDYPAAAPLEQFIDLILGRTQENDMDGAVGLKTVQVLEAAYTSAQSGRLEAVL